ncbi:unnamed protein product, partial [Staurois parvus]
MLKLICIARVTPHMSYQVIRGHWKKGRIREDRIKHPFCTMQRNNPLVCRMSITSMLYCQGRTDHLETRALPEGPGSVGGPMRCPWYL